MKIFEMKDSKKYESIVEPILAKKEACNNLALGIIDRLNRQITNGDHRLGIVKEQDKAVYAFLQTPPHNWILPDVEGASPDLATLIAKYLYNNESEVPGVIGPDHLATAFTKEWEKLTGKRGSVHMRQLIYQLDKVNSIDTAEGTLEKATKNNKAQVTKWLRQFGEEVNEPMEWERADELAKRFVETGSVYLWKVNGVPVSMVNRSRKTKNGVTINGVYTPDEHKRKGYATAAVSEFSTLLLHKGFKFCSLYTDLDNPTSNNIYKNIGYRQIGTSLVYHF
jgi:predicted GNAT family acetyltransferase